MPPTIQLLSVTFSFGAASVNVPILSRLSEGLGRGLLPT